MKHSIKKIFAQLKWNLLLILFLSLTILVMVFEHQLSFNKIDNLINQKKIISSLTDIKEKNSELAIIQLNGKTTTLQQKIDKLETMYKYHFTDRYILGNGDEYLSDLNELRKLTSLFNKTANKFYKITKKSEKKKLKDTFYNVFNKLNSKINNLIIKNYKYDEDKFLIMKSMIVFIFILILIITFWARSILDKIYADIEFLYQVNKKDGHEIFSIEADAIALRMNRKSIVNDNNPNNIDQVTGINNYRGLVSSYNQKKGLKTNYFTSVTVIEVDNFSKTNRAFSQEVSQNILKKIAYTISLHEQPIDVIARTDYNQFTIVFSRSTKEQTYRDVEIIRESISELKFNVAEKGNIQITVSGGHIIKPNNTNIDEAMKQAKEILAYAKSTGKNKILQKRDLPQR